MEFPPASAHPGVLHYIPPDLTAFEPTKPLARSLNINTLLWIDGIFARNLAVAYPMKIAQALGPTWSVMTASLGSAGWAWGAGSIAQDAKDMAKIITYIKELRPGGGKVVIMGHSTGCQDCMEYLVGKDAEQRPLVDGVILQAPVSDRESINSSLPEAHVNEANQVAADMCKDGRERDCLPNRLTKPVFGRVPVTARRWLDLASPAPDHAGADDYFSSDLPEERLTRTFGKLQSRTPLLVLFSGADEYVSKEVDFKRLSQHWLHIVERNGGSVDAINSGIVEGASHNLNGQSDDIVQGLVRRVSGFLSRLEKGEIGIKDGSKI